MSNSTGACFYKAKQKSGKIRRNSPSLFASTCQAQVAHNSHILRQKATEIMQKATVLPLSYYLYQLLAGTCQLIYILQRFRAVRGTFRRIFLVFLHAPVNLTTILRRFCQTDVLTVALPLIYCLPWPAVMHSCLPL